MVLVYLAVVVLLFLSYLHFHTRYSRYGRLIDKIPGPPALPIVGNSLIAINFTLEDAWLVVRKFFSEYYPFFKVWKVTSAVVFIRHPDDLKTVLSCKKNISKSDEYKYINCVVEDGILTSDGDHWHHRRKILSRAFTPELLDYYSKTVIKHAKKFVADLCSQTDDNVFNTPPLCLKFSIRVALEGLVGLDSEKIKPEEEDEYRNVFSEFSEMVAYRFLRPYIRDWMMKFLPIGRQQAKLKEVLNKFARKIVKEREIYHEHSEKSILKNDEDSAKRDRMSENMEDGKQCLLVTDVLLLAEKKGLIDRHGTLQETSTMLLAAFETSGTQMCFILSLLAENKKAQDLVRAEILEVLGDSEDGITINNVKKMEYLDRCIKESMRLLPAIPHIGRTITDEIELRNCKVPAGTDLYMSIYYVQRDPNIWPEPDKFDPDRFLPENIKDRHRFAYIPFSAGLRSCIGQKLGMMQMKILTAYIIHNFILEPVDLIANLKFELKITLLLDKIRLKFIKINR